METIKLIPVCVCPEWRKYGLLSLNDSQPRLYIHSSLRILLSE